MTTRSDKSLPGWTGSFGTQTPPSPVQTLKLELLGQRRAPFRFLSGTQRTSPPVRKRSNGPRKPSSPAPSQGSCCQPLRRYLLDCSLHVHACERVVRAFCREAANTGTAHTLAVRVRVESLASSLRIPSRLPQADDRSHLVVHIRTRQTRSPPRGFPGVSSLPSRPAPRATDLPRPPLSPVEAVLHLAL